MKTLDRYVGTLLGLACGDTLGMAVEGWTREQIQKHVGKVTSFMNPVIVKDAQGTPIGEDEFGKLKYYTSFLKKGEVTDDTILAVALGMSLVERGMSLDAVAQKQAEIYDEYQQKLGEGQNFFGYATQQGLQNILQGKSPRESGFLKSVGNAPPMKMAPLGLYIHATDAYEQGLDFAADVGHITHLDPRSIVAGVLQAYAVSALIDSPSKELFLDDLEFICERYEKPVTKENKWNKSGNILKRISWIKQNQDASTEQAYQELGVSSSVYCSFPFALFMFQKYWDIPLEGLIETVNFGGDCDTTGAMYGALAGANKGIFMPASWIEQVQFSSGIIYLANKLYALGDGND